MRTRISQKPLLTALFLLTLLAGPAAFAQQQGPGGMPAGGNMGGQQMGGPKQGPRGGGGQMFERLNLTAEQKQKLQSVRQQKQGQGQQLHQQIEQKRKALMQYMTQPNASESKALSMSKEIANLQEQAAEMRIQTWFQMKAIFTPEQLQQLQQMRQQVGQRRAQGGGGGGFKGGMRGRMHEGMMGRQGGMMQPGPQGGMPDMMGGQSPDGLF